MTRKPTLFLPNTFLSLLSSLLFRKLPHTLPENRLKILVYQVGNIGDLIISTPVYKALREKFPNAEITLLSSSGSRKYVGAEEIIKPLNYIDNIQTFIPDDFISWKEYYDFFLSIRKSKYDLVVYLPSNLWKTFHICRDMVFFFLSGMKYGVGFKVFEDYYYYLKHNISPRNEVERLFDLLEPLGIGNGDKEIEFAISKEHVEYIREYLSREKIGGDRIKIAVMPGGKYQSRLWPKEYFVQLINRINEMFSADIFLLGSEAEIKLTGEIKSQTKMKLFDTAGSLTLQQLGALIKECHLLVTNDTGPMHIAAAVGTPTVSIFSAVDIPFLWYPSGDNHRVFYNKVDCSPCFQQKCDNHICMEGISVETVYKGVEEQLKRIGIQENM